MKNVVVVGAGVIGSNAASQLASKLPPTHRVVLISETDFGYWPIGSLRAAVAPGWEDKVIMPLANFFAKGSRHVVLRGVRVTQLQDQSVTVDRVVHLDDESDSTEISFDYCVLATGSSYNFPSRPPQDTRSMDGMKALLREFQANIAKAKRVLVIGGGPVGVEFSAEIKEANPSAAVTLASAGPRLIGGGIKKSVSATLEKQLNGLGVEVAHDTRLDLSGLSTGPVQEKRSFQVGGKTIEPDFIVLAIGNKPRSELVETLDKNALDAQNLTRVESSLQVVGHPRIFAVGDVTDVKEDKLAFHGQNHVPVVAKNIVALIKQPNGTTLKTYKAGGPLMVVTVGKTGGAGQIFFGISMPSFMVAAAKSKDLLTPKFADAYMKSASSSSPPSESRQPSMLQISLAVAALGITGAYAWQRLTAA